MSTLEAGLTDAPADKDETKRDGRLGREQCYLCIMSAAEAPAAAPPVATVKSAHKDYLAELERQGALVGAGRLINEAEGETSDLGVGLMIVRATTRAEAERIAFAEPFTKAGYRTMQLVPWQRTEGDMHITIKLLDGTLTVDRRAYTIKPA